MKKTKVVVCGATGSQGRAVLNAFLEDTKTDQYEIVALTRNPKALQAQYQHMHAHSENVSERTAAATLLKMVQIVQADWLDFESLCRAFAGADIVFGVTQPWNKDYTHADADAEIQQGRNILDACLLTQVKHLIFSSAANLSENPNQKSGIPHVDSKFELEAMIQEKAAASNLTYTILQPVQFIDNLGLSFFPVTDKGWIQGFVHKDSKVPWVAVRDIGKLAKLVADTCTTTRSTKENVFAGKKIVLVGDFVSGVELAQSMTKIRHYAYPRTTFQYWAPPAWVIRCFSLEFYKMRTSFQDMAANPVTVDRIHHCMAECRGLHPDMMSVEDYLKHAQWDTRDLVPPPSSSTKRTHTKNAVWIGSAAAALSVATAVAGTTATQKSTLGMSVALFAMTAMIGTMATRTKKKDSSSPPSDDVGRNDTHIEPKTRIKQAPWKQDFVPLTIDDYVDSDLFLIDNNGDASFTGVWHSAKGLLSYLEQQHSNGNEEQETLLAGDILELGAGTGWLGITLASNLGGGGGNAHDNNTNLKSIVLTDSSRTGATAWIQRNLEAAKQQQLPNLECVSVVPLDWNDQEQVKGVAKLKPWRVILGSDLIYSEAGAQALAQTMKTLLVESTRIKAAHSPRIIYGHTLGRMPELDDLFHQALKANGLQWVILEKLPVLCNGAPWEGRSTVVMDIYESGVL